jgi:hypothetical protein
VVAVVSAVIGLIGIVIVGALALVAQMIPAVFHLCIFIERFIFMLVSQVTNRLLSVGLLTGISALVWAIAAALVGTPFLSRYFGQGITLWLFLAGGMWGLVIGYQAALLEYAHQLRRPGVLVEQRPGILPPPGASGAPSQSKSLEELWSEGIILGEVSDSE